MIYTGDYLKNLTDNGLIHFLDVNRLKLAGSAVFTRNKSLVSKIVSSVCRGKCDKEEWIPSHVGSLVLMGGGVYLFDMKPPKATLTKLKNYIKETNDDFIIVMRDFELDVEKFSFNICDRNKNYYGYISAVQSAFKWLWYPLREHCSEIHLKELNEQKLFTQYKPNNTTPKDLLEILNKGHYYCSGDL